MELSCYFGKRLLTDRDTSHLGKVTFISLRLQFIDHLTDNYIKLGQTFNVKLLPSGEIRKVNRFTVIELNGEEVIL